MESLPTILWPIMLIVEPILQRFVSDINEYFIISKIHGEVCIIDAIKLYMATFS